MSKINCFIPAVVLAFTFSIAQSKMGFSKDQDPAVEKIVTEHVKSVGDPTLLAATKSRAFLGTASAEFILGASGSMTGDSMFVSEGQKLAIVMKYGDINYPQEYFAFDGKDVTVGNISPGQRSPLADFLLRNNGIIKEGLFGGVLSGNWPLLNLQAAKPGLKSKETTVQGRKVYEVEYMPKSRLGDVKIKMYFDAETFHHLKTEYKIRHREDMSSAPTAPKLIGSRTPDSIYQLTETFDDFKKEGDMTLPHSYTIEYSFEGQGGSFIAKWNMKPAKWSFNTAYDERIFKAQK